MKTKKGNILILFSFLLCLVFGSLVLAVGSEWGQYGSSNTYLTQSQTTSLNADFNISSPTAFTSSIGQIQYDYPTQPLISDLEDSSNNFLIIQNFTHITLFNNNLSYYTSFQLEHTPIAQHSIVDWNNDGKKKIAGIYRVNATQMLFAVHQLNLGSATLSQLYNYTINLTTLTYNNITGLRCRDTKCFAVAYEYNGTSVNHTQWLYSFFASTSNVSLTNLNFNYTRYSSFRGSITPIDAVGIPLETPSEFDYDNDATYDYLIFTDRFIGVYDEYNNRIINFSFYQNSADFQIFVRSAKWLDDGSEQKKIAVNFEIPNSAGSSTACQQESGSSASFVCSILNLFDVDSRTPYYKGYTGLSVNSGDNHRIVGVAVGDYDNNGKDNIFVFTSNLGTNENVRAGVYDIDGSENYFNSSIIAGKIGNVYPNGQLTLGRLDNSGNYTFIVYDGNGGKLWLYSPFRTSVIYYNNLDAIGSTRGSCIPANLNNDGNLDLFCSSFSATYMFSGNTAQEPVNVVNTSVQGGGNSGYNSIIEAFDGAFPDSEDLTSSQKILFTIISMLVVFLVVIIPFVLAYRRIEPLALYIALFFVVMTFLFFIGKGYIGTGILVLMVLIVLAIAGLKIFRSNGSV